MAIVDPTTPGELWYDIPSRPGYQFSSEFRVKEFLVFGRCFPRRLIKTPRMITVNLWSQRIFVFQYKSQWKTKANVRSSCCCRACLWRNF